MANTCYTNVHIISDDTQEINTLFHELQAADALTTYEKHWLGNLWMHLGSSFDDAMNGKLGPCAGQIDGIYLVDQNYIDLDITSKYEPQLKAIRDFTAKYAPSAKIEFFGIEPEDDLYVTNMPENTYAYSDVTDDLPDDMSLEDWSGFFPVKDFTQQMITLLNADPATGFNALAQAIEAAYPIHISILKHISLDDACQLSHE